MEVAEFRTIDVATEEQLQRGAWVDEAKQLLASDGAALLRTDVVRPDAAEIALGLIDGELLEDAFWSTPRSRVSKNTLTATEYPSARTIAPHSEMSYMPVWPRLIAFHSIEVAAEGGETTVGDIDRISADIGDVVDDFAREGVTYRRTFQPRFDVTWQKAFQTENPNDVEEIGRRFGMCVEWLDGDFLVTTHSAQGAITSADGRSIYFNQAHLFHPSSLGTEVRGALERALGPERLPRLSTLGDGSPIADEILARVRDSFDAHLKRVAWRKGDILILDNMRFAHGRRPFSGARKLHVALARAVREPVRGPLF